MQPTRQQFYGLVFGLMALLGWCSDSISQGFIEPLKPPTVLIGVGDSLTHGTMNGVNNSINTLHAYLQLVAQSLSLVLPVKFSQPLFDTDENRKLPFRIPTNLAVTGADVFALEGLRYYKRAGVDKSFLSTDLLSDVVLPRKFNDKYDKVMFPINILAGHPVSQIDAAVWHLDRLAAEAQRQQVILFLWIGTNESGLAVLGSGGENPIFLPFPLEQIASELKPTLRLILQVAHKQGWISVAPYTNANIERNLTNLDDFTAQFNQVLTRLVDAAPVSRVDLQLFVLTVPYLSATAYLFDSEDLEFYLQKVDPDYRTPPTFKRVALPGQPITNPLQGDRVAVLTFGMMAALLDTGHSISEVNTILEQDGRQQDGLVLSEAENRLIMSRTDQYNRAIQAAARRHGKRVRVIDIGQFMNDVFLGRTEVVVGDVVLSRKWSRGSGFSIDGVHPGHVGHAIIANEVLQQVNDYLRIDAPLYNLSRILAADPYVDKDRDGWVPGPTYQIAGISEMLLLFTDPNDRNPSVQPDIPDDFWDQFSDIILRHIRLQASIGNQIATLEQLLP